MQLVTRIVRTQRTSWWCLLLVITVIGLPIWLTLYHEQMYMLRSYQPNASTISKTSSSSSSSSSLITSTTTTISPTTTTIFTTAPPTITPISSSVQQNSSEQEEPNQISVTPTVPPTIITPMELLTVQQNLPSEEEEEEQDQVSEEIVEVVILCVEDKPYGQTFNMILTIAAARSVAYEWSLNHTTNTNTTNTTQVYYKVGFGPYFSNFIKATLEPPEDILLYYYKHLPINNETSSTNDQCHFQLKAMDLFYNFFQMDWNVNSRIQLVQSLIPKRAIRDLARSYLQQQQQMHRTNPNGRNTTTTAIVTTVHRRNFEKSCLVRSQNRDKVLCLDLTTGNRRNTTESLSNHELSDLCQLNYPMIQKDLKITKLNQKNYIVLLCSDRQVPKYDQTFPHLVNIEPEMLNAAAVAADDDHDDLLGNHTSNHTINKHSKTIMMMTEAWMMTLSDIHYGIPMSTVDLVVYIWRNSPLLFMLDDNNDKQQPEHRREMRPLSCYGPSRPM